MRKFFVVVFALILFLLHTSAFIAAPLTPTELPRPAAFESIKSCFHSLWSAVTQGRIPIVLRSQPALFLLLGWSLLFFHRRTSGYFYSISDRIRTWILAMLEGCLRVLISVTVHRLALDWSERESFGAAQGIGLGAMLVPLLVKMGRRFGGGRPTQATTSTPTAPKNEVPIATVNAVDQVAGQSSLANYLQHSKGRGQIGFGGLWLDESRLTSHYLFLGESGSGKTSLMGALLKSRVFGDLVGVKANKSQTGIPNHRALIFDYKGDWMSLLSRIGADWNRIHITHPMFSMAKRWEIAEDFSSRAQFIQLANTFIEEGDTSDRFWTDSSRAVLAEVLVTLSRRFARRWQLLDVLIATASLARLRSFLCETREGVAIVKQYLPGEGEDGKQAGTILSTIRSRLAALEPIALAWRDCPRSFSITSWLFDSEAKLLLVSGDPTAAESLNPIIRSLLRRTVELVLAQSDQNSVETWLFLDEVRMLGRNESLLHLTNAGRSKKAHVVLGVQDIEGLRAEYGNEVADEIMSQCGNRAMLRISNPRTAQWASDAVGSQWYNISTFSESASNYGSGQTKSYSQEIRARLLPAAFQELRLASLDNGVVGYFQIPSLGTWGAMIPGYWITMCESPSSGNSVPERNSNWADRHEMPSGFGNGPESFMAEGLDAA